MSARVNRDQLTSIGLGLLAVVALSVSAATLDVTRQEPSQESGDAGVGGDGSTFDSGAPPAIDSSPADPLLVTLLRFLFGVVMILGFITLLMQVYRQGWRSLIPVFIAAVVCVLALAALYHALSPGSPGNSENGMLGENQPSFPSGSPLASGDDGSVLSNAPVTVDTPEVVLFVVVGLAVGIGLLVLNRTTNDSLLAHRAESDETTSPDRSETAAVGAAAGRAADRIEADETVSNAVYRAWREMTSHLDLPRETSTPGEFAVAATETGMSPEDVEELTRLFEATRYGDQAVTERREQRALTALRRIEREYASDETNVREP